jgi:hypothetical protein
MTWRCSYCRTPLKDREDDDPHFKTCIDFEFMKEIYKLHCEFFNIEYPEGHALKLGWSLGLVTYRPEDKNHIQYEFLTKARDLCVEYIKKGSSQAWSHFNEGGFQFTFTEWEEIDEEYHDKMLKEITDLAGILTSLYMNKDLFNIRMHFVPHLENFAEKYKWASDNFTRQR